jgi:hypothetical protein
MLSKVAVIVETREHNALPFVLNNVMSILPEDYTLQIFHGTSNYDYVYDSVENDMMLLDKEVEFTNLNIDSISADDSSLEIMLTKDFWNKVVGENVLYFECDTMLCPNSEFKIEDFENFNYIGGYWGNELGMMNQKYNRVMNGGLSFRKKSFMLDIIENKLQSYLDNGGNPCEDYFVSEMVEDKPTYEEVLSFSIDNGYMYPINDKAPFGLHKPWGEVKSKGHGKYYDDIKKVCEDVEKLEIYNG